MNYGVYRFELESGFYEWKFEHFNERIKYVD